MSCRDIVTSRKSSSEHSIITAIVNCHRSDISLRLQGHGGFRSQWECHVVYFYRVINDSDFPFRYHHLGHHLTTDLDPFSFRCSWTTIVTFHYLKLLANLGK